MPAVFISHSSLDRKAAEDVKAVLERLGFERTFLDFDKHTGIGAGENWERRLYEELARCHAVILVLTPNWLASKWCFAELTHARSMGKILLPILCEPLGEQFAFPEIQSIDLLDRSAEGLARLEQRLHAIANELARGFQLDPARPPYPGIHAFEFEDAAIYFGRDDETRAVIERLDARRTQGGARLQILIGASGSGKSSLLKAGVLPQLARRRAHWLPLPVVRPERAPLEALAKALAYALAEPNAWEHLAGKLGGPDAIDEIARLAARLRVADARAATLLLPVDQLEEVFTVATPEERDGFLRLLAGMLDPRRGIPVMVLATGRSDFLDELIDAVALANLYETIALTPLPLGRVPRLVEGPAAVAGLYVEKGLAEQIAHDVGSPEALPLLAHTLWLLHRRGGTRLSAADYASLGDPQRGLNPIQNSVRLVADQAVAGLNPSPAELSALRDAFVPHLVRVRLDDGTHVRQPARRGDLPAQSVRLVDALVTARLLSTRDGLVEVAHEALFKAWPTLDRWLTGERDFLTDLERIRGAQAIWMQAPDDKKTGARLHGFLLARARDWLRQHPQRFAGSDAEPLGAFIEFSTRIEEAEQAKARRLQKLAFRGAIAASIVFAILAALSAGGIYIAEMQRNEALLAQSRFLARDSRIATEEGDVTLGALLALAALPKDLQNPDRPFLREAAFALEQAFANRRERLSLSANIGLVQTVEYAPDGGRVVAAGGKSAKIWDAQSGKELALLSHAGDVRWATWLAGGKRIVTLDRGRSYERTNIWDAASATKIMALGGEDLDDQRPLFSADGARVIMVSGRDPVARMWDMETGKVVATLGGKLSGNTSASFSRDGKQVVTAHDGGTLRLWDAATGAQTAVFRQPEVYISYDPELSPDGALIVAKSISGLVHIWDAKAGTVVATLKGHQQYVKAARFSRDGGHVITASNDRTVRLWNARTGEAVVTLSGFDGDVWRQALSPDGSRLATASDDRTVRLWDAATGAQVSLVRGTGEHFPSFVFSPDGSRLLVQFNDPFQAEDLTRLVDCKTGRELAQLKGRLNAGGVAAFSRDGARVLTTSRDGAVRIWRMNDGASVAVLKGHTNWATAATFAPGGAEIVSSSIDGTVRVWTAEPMSVLATFRGHEGPVGSVRVSSDGGRIVTSSSDKTARLWDLKSGALVRSFAGHDDVVHDAALSPDGAHLLTASADGTARIWNVQTGELVRVLRGHDGAVRAAAFSPDGSRIVTASADKTARIWVTESGLPTSVLGTEAEVHAARYSPDGKRILTVARGGAIVAIIWDAATGARLKELRPDVDNPALSPAWNLMLRGTERGARAHAAMSGGGSRDGAFSPDSYQVVTTSVGVLLQLWDAEVGLKRGNLGTTAGVNSAAFSPDGKRVIAAYDDGVARAWDIALQLPMERSPIAELRAHDAKVRSVAYLGDGARAVTASDDKTVRLWQLPRCRALVDAARRWAPRELDSSERGRYFLHEKPPDRAEKIYAAVRPWLAFALPRTGDTCN